MRFVTKEKKNALPKIVKLKKLSRIAFDANFDFPGVKTVLSAIDGILSSSDTQEIDECESALEALGQIGSCKYASTFSRLGK